MSWSRKSLTLLATVLIGGSMLAAKKEDSAKKPDKTDTKKDKKKDAPDAKPAETAPADAEKAPGKISVPVPPGHDARGLIIPIRTPAGVMQMRFTMEIGARTDVNHMDMTTLLIETFDEEGKNEMAIDLPRSVLDLETRIITTNSGVKIKREDFEIAGQNMEFNTETRAGRITGGGATGKVRMLIYNLENETNPDPAEGSSEK